MTEEKTYTEKQVVDMITSVRIQERIQFNKYLSDIGVPLANRPPQLQEADKFMWSRIIGPAAPAAEEATDKEPE